MQVKRDFEQIYAAEDDPWTIGDADSERYNLYYNIILNRAVSHSVIIDIGCGYGAFLARFHHYFDELVGVEVSHLAVAKGRARYPFINFVEGSADSLDCALLDDNKFDAVIYSDVINYFNEASKNRSLQWISGHLSDEGFAFIAAYSPGGNYLTFEELKRMVDRYFVIEEEMFLESEHAIFVCRKRRSLVAITIDHETWQPIPPGKKINWEKDVFQPTELLLALFDTEGIKLTLMAELGEYLWLKDNNKPVSIRMEEQWADAVRKGHDVQLHLHPTWLPELGARYENKRWIWDSTKVKITDYPGDLSQLIAKCKSVLESVLRPINPEYKVTSFRAGAYEAQPFKRLYDALEANEIFCDSSVYPGSKRWDRHYDYSLAYSTHQPYFASRYDPQLKAPPAERAIVELPVFSYSPGSRWTFDGSEGKLFDHRLLNFSRQLATDRSSESYRRNEKLKLLLRAIYHHLHRYRRVTNALIPRSATQYITQYAPERLTGSEFFVLVSHSKADLDIDEIQRGLRTLREEGKYELVTLTEMAEIARQELLQSLTKSPQDEAKRQIEREYNVVLGNERNEAQSAHLQRMIPLDRTKVLDLGCGAGAWSDRIATLHPWMKVTGIDVGEDFIAKAIADYSSERVSFQVEDFSELSLPDEKFDCVYADNSLEHAFDVDQVLSEIYRVLMPGGVLVAALPSDARNPGRVCDNHTWKTSPHEVRERLEGAGFVNVEVYELDTFRRLGMAPYPPANDMMMYARAWKRLETLTEMERVDELKSWVYGRLSPDRDPGTDDPFQILVGGFALCAGYCGVLGEALRREGYRVSWISMLAEDHPKGRGLNHTDSHEVLEVIFRNGARIVVDPMANVTFLNSIDTLLQSPELADIPRERDKRYRQRQYDLYATSFWYSRVKKVAHRDKLREEIIYEPVRRFTGRSTPVVRIRRLIARLHAQFK